jgi:hypothetical protein
MDVKPNDEIVEEPAADEDDVEGHSVLSSIAMSGAFRAPAPRDDKARNKNGREPAASDQAVPVDARGSPQVASSG